MNDWIASVEAWKRRRRGEPEPLPEPQPLPFTRWPLGLLLTPEGLAASFDVANDRRAR